MQKVCFTVEKQTTQCYEGYKLLYRLLTSNDGTVPSYSIYVNIKSGEPSCLRESLVYDITTIQDFAHEIFDSVSKGHVTPVTLFDVIEDIIA